jgi:hypothetical protein
MQKYGYNPNDTTSHFNAQGCYLIGKALAEHIQKHYTIVNTADIF